MNILTVLFIVRLIPYIIALLNAYKKGYRWLTAASAYLILITVIFYAQASLNVFTQILAVIFAYLFMMHSLNIKSKEKK